MTQADWLESVLQTLSQHTDRKIEVRMKSGLDTERSFAATLKGVHAVIVFTSIAGVQATMHGVPCFATHPCAASLVGKSDLSQIESPLYPSNREELAIWLAANQWTIEEIREGLAWRTIK
jgi:hypothetical protein